MIVKYPDPILLKRAEEVDLDEARQIMIQISYEILAQYWGKVAGLAAPQIGISKRVFQAQGKWYINPEIIKIGQVSPGYQEGCYSLEENKFDYSTKRASWLILRWTTELGHKKEQRFQGLAAQVIQHEYDHLEGRLCHQT